MNVRLSEDGVRFRITQDEFEELLSREELSGETFFPRDKGIKYSISVTHSERSEKNPSIDFDDNKIGMQVSRKDLINLAAKPISKESKIEREETTSRGVVRYSLEIDIRRKKVAE